MSSQQNTLETLILFGFPSELCQKVLELNPNGTVEQLVDQLVQMQNNSESSTTTATTQATTTTNEHVSNLNKKYSEYVNKTFPTGQLAYKMIFVVRNDLNMGKGKIAAQCCHAAVGLYRNILYENLDYFEGHSIGREDFKQWREWLHGWELTAEAKICVKVDSEKDMDSLFNTCLKEKINCYLVVDAGRTQIEAGSKTVLGIGPCPIDRMDKITKHLKLL